MITPKQVLIDTNVLVALVDTRDTWHARAQAVREALKTTAVSLAYCDVVLNEAIGVLARRAQEQRRVDQFAGLVHTLLHAVPSDIIVWLSSETQRLYAQVIELVQSTSGDLNFHDALIALGCRLLGIEVIASFDRDFEQIAWLTRVDTAEAVMAVFAPLPDTEPHK
jgi:predicted nucleic acid-binding protein